MSRDLRFLYLDAEIAAGRGEHPGELQLLFGGPAVEIPTSKKLALEEHAAAMRERAQQRKPKSNVRGLTMRELTTIALKKCNSDGG